MANLVDYSHLGITSKMRAISGPGGRPKRIAKPVNPVDELPIEGVGFTKLNRFARPYRAVVTMSGEGDTFSDIQGAINHVHDMGGGVVFIKTGTYRPGKYIYIRDDVEILGESVYNTIVDFEMGAYGFYTFADEGKGVKVSNLSIINSTWCGIWLQNGPFSLIENVVFGTTSAMIMLHVGSDNSVIRNCSYLDIGGTPAYNAISVVQSSGVSIYNNSLINCNARGIYGTAVTDINIFGNEIGTAANGGIEIVGSDSDYISISGNSIRDTGEAGILLSANDRSSVYGNHLKACGSTGIALIDSAGNTLQGNTITDGAGYGVEIDADSDNNVLTANTIHWNTTYGVAVLGLENVINSNSIKITSGTDIYLGTATEDCRVIGNSVGTIDNQGTNNIVEHN